MSRKTADRKPGTGEVPPVVHNVLKSPGWPLSAPALSFMNSRFKRDFSAVRVHTDTRAAESAQAVDALAYTAGQHIVFGRGAYAPDTLQGKRLLAHELTHVAQQQQASTGLAGSEESLEKEADHVSSAVMSASPKAVRHGARPGGLQFVPRVVQGRTFEVGDIQLNPGASTDVRTRGVLLPGPDQAHILVTGDQKLGYEVSHTAPDDPFRWERLKEIVDNGHADITAVSATQRFPVKEVRGTTESIVQRSLAALGFAGGITLPRVSIQRAINPGAAVIVASANDSRDAIFYDSSAGGRGLFGSNSLAHELFGHLWLAMRRVPFQHGGQLTAAHGVQDPMGRTFAGSVTSYIDQFAGASQTVLPSPTQRVSLSHLNTALGWLFHQGANHLSLNNNIGSATTAFGLQWEVISQNYEVLLVGPQPATVTPTLGNAAGVRGGIVGWYNGTLNANQKIAFRSVLLGITTNFGLNRRTRLARDVLNQLPSAPPQGTP